MEKYAPSTSRWPLSLSDPRAKMKQMLHCYSLPSIPGANMTSEEMKSKIEELLRGQPGRLLGASGEPLRAGKDILAAIRQLVEDDLKHLDDGGPRDVPS